MQKTNTLLRIMLSFLFILALSLEGLMAQTPSLVKDINSGTASSTPSVYTIYNNKLYFSAADGSLSTTNRFFKTDGTNSGTVGIPNPFNISATTHLNTSNLAPGAGSSSNVLIYNSVLYFQGLASTYSGATPTNKGTRLCKMDANENITLISDNINTSNNNVGPSSLTLFNNKIYFSGITTSLGSQLCEYDPTQSSAVVTTNINSAASSAPTGLTVVGNKLCFSATDGGTSYGKELWVLSTSSNTPVVADIYSGSANSSNPSNFTAMGGKLYFSATNATGAQLWCYDPNSSISVGTNPYIVKPSSITLTAVTNLLAIGSTVYFSATDATNGTELWKTDGTANGTVLVKDIYAGSANSSSPANLTNLNGTLFFSATDATGTQLWKTDGTANGTVQLTTTLTAVSQLSAINNTVLNTYQLFFSGTDATYGAQPWVSDGTTAGTYRIGIINSSAGSNPAGFTYFNGMVYFRASNGTTGSFIGSELYKYGYNTWTGTTSNNFSLASNWSAGFVPDYTTDVKIPLVSTMPSLTGTNTIRGLNVPTGVTLTNTGTLQVGGDLVNNGTINGTLQLNGSASQAVNGLTNTAQSISGTGTIANLTLPTYNSVAGGSTAYTNGATITSGMQSLTGTLLVQAGTLTTGGFLTLKSTSIANSAVVDVVGSGSTTGISGNVTVERYIPQGFRGYRDMAPEVYGAGSIYANWQSGGAMTSGSGIFITGPGAKQANTGNFYGAAYPNTVAQPAPNASNGLDYSIGGLASIFSYNNTTGTFNWNYGGTTNTYTTGAVAYGITDTKGTNLDAFTGYRVVVRGDRNFNLGTTPIVSTVPNSLNMYNATTLKATGSLVYGTITYSKTGVTGNGNGATPIFTSANYFNTSLTKFSMVANPYVCPVDWATVYTASTTLASGGTPLGINASYWFLDPTTSSYGTYRAYNALSGSSSVPHTYTYTSGGSSIDAPLGYPYIQAGQAVYVQATSSDPKVVFNEAAKVASTPKTSVFGTSTLSKLYISLLKQATATTYDRVDGAAVAFRADFGNTIYGPQDALKFNSANDNIAIINKGKELSIDGRLPATASDVIALAISKPSSNKYQLEVDAAAYVSNGFKPSLFDAYNKTTTALSAGITTIDFTVDTAVVASFSNRFSILFAPSALPVNSILASASLNNKVATITWNTVGEQHVARFEVEKSTDAKTFATIRQSIAKNTTTAVYSTTDNNVTATSYYRIKAVSTTGATSYSNVAKLTTNNSPLTTIYPNPLKGKTLNVSMDNLVAGKYTVSIINVLGVKVSEQTINHFGGSATHAITISNTLAAGTYSVTISEVGSKQLVHQSTLSVQP